MDRTSQSFRSLPAILMMITLVTGCVSTETANVGETHWHCENNVKLIANKANRTGVVTFGGTKYDTSFTVRGLENVWEWGPRGEYEIYMGVSEYGFVRYYDFTGTKPGEKRKPKSVFACYTS